MPLCSNYKQIADNYKTIIDSQTEHINELNKKIDKLENSLKTLQEACKYNSQFEEYFAFYVKDRKQYNTVFNELKRILDKFNC